MGVVNCRLRNDFLRGVVENGRRSVYVCVGGGGGGVDLALDFNWISHCIIQPIAFHDRAMKMKSCKPLK